MRNRSDKPKKLQVPKEARKSYHDALGKLLAKERVQELKAAQYGKLNSVDRFQTTKPLPGKAGGFTSTDREKIYRKAMQLYDQNELIRPIINLIASSIFSTGQPDIKGKNEKLVKLAQDIITESDINFHDLAREGELAGDVFLAFDSPNKERTQILSLDAGKVDVRLKENNIREIQGYELNKSGKVDIDTEHCQHLRFNTTTTSQYGRSSLRHVIYWIDVLDFLFESKWLRGADNYGQPLLAVTGVPAQFQASFKASLEAEVQRSGKTWILPPDTNVITPSMSLDYPIGDIVGWVFRMISIATEIPITLLGSADAASRGSAFFANPRFVLAIRPRREVWRIGLRRFFIKLFQAEGMVGDEPISRKDFDISFLPIFEKDMAELADVISIARDKQIISKETAMEWLGLDASDEFEKIEDEPEDKLQQMPVDPDLDKKLSATMKKTKRNGAGAE